MALDPITAALDLGSKVIDKLFPDKQAADAAKLKLLEMQQNGELAKLTADTTIAQAQNETNKIEAASTRLWVSGWRPAVGWVCAAAFAFKYVGGPLLLMIGQAAGIKIDLPPIDMSDLLPILLGMLGLGAMRTTEKVKGVA